jgi:hypothetical protein
MLCALNPVTSLAAQEQSSLRDLIKRNYTQKKTSPPTILPSAHFLWSRFNSHFRQLQVAHSNIPPTPRGHPVTQRPKFRLPTPLTALLQHAHRLPLFHKRSWLSILVDAAPAPDFRNLSGVLTVRVRHVFLGGFGYRRGCHGACASAWDVTVGGTCWWFG